MVFSHTAANSHSFHCFRLLLLMKNKQNGLGAEECSLKHSQHEASAPVYNWSLKGRCVVPVQKRRVQAHSVLRSSVSRPQFWEVFRAFGTQQGNQLQWLDALPCQQIEVIPWRHTQSKFQHWTCRFSKVFQSRVSKWKYSLLGKFFYQKGK